jgi:hypothetical protein
VLAAKAIVKGLKEVQKYPPQKEFVYLKLLVCTDDVLQQMNDLKPFFFGTIVRLKTKSEQ